MSKCDEFCDCKIGQDMGKIKDLAVAGVTDLESYNIGKQDGERQAPGEHVREFYRKQGAERERQRIIDLFKEQDDAAWLGLAKAAIFLIEGRIEGVKGENK